MEHRLYDRLAAIVEPSLNAMGYTLVLIRLLEGGKRTLRIMAEHIDGKPMTADNCADISRQVSALLDVEDPIAGAYNLEISSPGIDRPLVKLSDFERFSGYEARLETRLPIEGRKRFKGRLKGLEKEEIIVSMEEGGLVRIPFSMLHAAKLVLNDELLKAAITN